MDGLVVGNQIHCYSPAAKEVPRIITENGEYIPPQRQSWGAGSPSFCLGRRTHHRYVGAEEPMDRGGSKEEVSW